MSIKFTCDKCGDRIPVSPPMDERTDFDFGKVLDPERRSRGRDEVNHLCEGCTDEFQQWLAE